MNTTDNNSIQRTKRFSVEDIPTEEVDIPSIELEKSDALNNTESFVEPIESDYEPAADAAADRAARYEINERDDYVKAPKRESAVVELDLKKLILVIILIALIVGLIIAAIIIVPHLLQKEPVNDAHWSAPITDNILTNPNYDVMSVIQTKDNLEKLISGEQFYQLGLRLVEGNPGNWSGAAYFRSKLVMAKIDAVDLMTSMYEAVGRSVDRSAMYNLLTFSKTDFADYEPSVSGNLTIAESLVFFYRLISSPSFGYGPSGPRYMYTPTATPTPYFPTPTPTPTPAPTPTPTATPEPTPTPTAVSELTEPVIDSNISGWSDSVVIMFRFPDWATNMEYNVNDLFPVTSSWTSTTNNAVITVKENSKYTIRCKKNGEGDWLTAELNITNIDSSAPLITYLADQTPCDSLEIALYINDSPNGSGIRQVKWAKGNLSASYFADQGTVLAPTAGSQYKFTVIENGTYTVYAVDEAGNKAVSTVEITCIDNAAPLIVIRNNPRTWQKNPVEFTVTVSDANLYSVQYIDNGVVHDIPLDETGAVTDYVIRIETESTAASDTSVIITANDSVGNQRIVTVLLKIDMTKPSVPEIIDLEYVEPGLARFRLSEAVDSISGIASVSVTRENVELFVDEDNYFTVPNNSVILIMVTDNAGNT
ncbi:MAG: hypothetical protein KIG36_03420, partial [Eubacteriales bacterium]|nr:hypothetical protein [Eubacteriales bacterium]